MARTKRLQRSHLRAFTLVELLTVMAIIAVLLSMLVPALSRARFQALSLRCLSNLSVIGNAIHAYGADNAEALPWDAPPGFPDGWPQMGVVDVWRLLRPEIPNGSFFTCPADYDPPFTQWWIENYGASYGYPNVSALDFPSSYYYEYSCYHHFDDPSLPTNNPGLACQMFIRSVIHPQLKSIVICYGQRSGPLGQELGAHGINCYNWLFADGHAGNIPFAEINPADPPDGTGPYNMDWAKGGLAGRDIRN